MFQAKEYIPKDIQEFLEEVISRTKGYDVYLGGGYLRDIWWNIKNVKGLHFAHGKWWSDSGLHSTVPKQPKDLDLFFIPQNGVVEKELPTIPKTYVNYDVMAEDIPNVRENVYRVRGLFNSHISTRDIQFIIYDKPMDIVNMADDMDIDINQVMYEPLTDVTHGSLAFYYAHENKSFQILHTFEEERMYGRLKRMEKKFPDYEMKHGFDELTWLTLETENTKIRKRPSGSTGSFICDEFDDAL